VLAADVRRALHCCGKGRRGAARAGAFSRNVVLAGRAGQRSAPAQEINRNAHYSPPTALPQTGPMRHRATANGPSTTKRSD